MHPAAIVAQEINYFFNTPDGRRKTNKTGKVVASGGALGSAGLGVAAAVLFPPVIPAALVVGSALALAGGYYWLARRFTKEEFVATWEMVPNNENKALQLLRATPFRNTTELRQKVDAGIEGSRLAQSDLGRKAFLDIATESAIFAMIGKRWTKGNPDTYIEDSLPATMKEIVKKEGARSEEIRRDHVAYGGLLISTDNPVRGMLSSIGEEYAKIGKLDLALALAQEMSGHNRGKILETVALSQLHSGKNHDAYKTLGKIMESPRLVAILPNLLPEFAKTLIAQGKAKEASALWDKIVNSYDFDPYIRHFGEKNPSYVPGETIFLASIGAKTLYEAGKQEEANDLITIAQDLVGGSAGDETATFLAPEYDGTLRDLVAEATRYVAGEGVVKPVRPQKPEYFGKFAQVVSLMQGR